MYEVLKNYLSNARYTLEDAMKRIDYGVLAGHIVPEQAEELLTLAQTHADPCANGLEVDIQALQQHVAALEQEATSTMLAVAELYEMII